MASSADQDTSKLIFAPGSKEGSTQAGQFLKGNLELASLSKSPFTQFHQWFEEARKYPVPQAESVCLSTAALPSGAPSCRFVYLKELDSRGFVVYSNWGTSRKAEDVQSNPQAALAFWWREMERQVRIEGKTEMLSQEESQSYYSLRERGSKIGAWASEQSKVLPESEGGREVLEKRVREVEEKWKDHPDEDIKCPPFWGGMRVIPSSIEFFQGRQSRLHDRFKYTREGESPENWKIERLSP